MNKVNISMPPSYLLSHSELIMCTTVLISNVL